MRYFALFNAIILKLNLNLLISFTIWYQMRRIKCKYIVEQCG